MATADPQYNPPLSGGGVTAKDDGSTVVTTSTAIDFVDSASVAFTVTNAGSGVAQVSATATGGGSGGAPDNATYVTLTTSAGLSAERTLAVESSVLTLTDGGANGAATIAVASNGITDAKLRQGVARSVIGVTGNATANVADIQGTADQVLRVNAAGTALAFGTVAAGGIASDAVTTAKILDANVTDAKLANMGALSVKGRNVNSSGVPADIQATASSGAVLRESGSTIGFGTVAAAGLASDSVTTTKILDANVTYAKIANATARSLLGRSANSSGVLADIAGGGASTFASDDGSTVAFRVVSDLPQNLTISGDITPTQITADQNNYNPTSLSTAAVIRVSTDATRNITGLAGGADGRLVYILNVGSFSVVLNDESASSTAGNRFALGADRTIATKEGICLLYDSTSSRWRATDQAPGSGGGGGAPTGAQYVTLAADGTLTSERVLTASTRVTVTDAGAGSTVTLDLGTNSVGDTYLRQGAARTVIGRSANSTGNVADIAGGGASTFLSDDGSTLAFRVVSDIPQNLTLSGDISPTQLAANTNDWAPTSLSTAAVIRFSTDASRDITGLTGGADGRLVLLLNIGSNNAVLKNESASSTAGNRFTFGSDRTLAASEGLLLWYDSTSSRWRPTTQAPGAGGGGTTTDLPQNITFSGDISPSQITSNQNDYNPTSLSTSSTIRITTDASRNITGLQGGADGRIIIFQNVGSNNAVFTPNDSGSSAANRFDIGSDIILRPSCCAVFQYDGTSSLWRPLARPPTTQVYGVQHQGDSSTAPGANQITGVSFYLPFPSRCLELHAFVATAAGSIRMGIYNSSSAGDPNALQCETSGATAASGIQTFTPTTFPVLQQGLYWIVVNNDNASLTMRKGVSAYRKQFASQTYGSLPATFPTPSTGNDGYCFTASMVPA